MPRNWTYVFLQWKVQKNVPRPPFSQKLSIIKIQTKTIRLRNRLTENGNPNNAFKGNTRKVKEPFLWHLRVMPRNNMSAQL